MLIQLNCLKASSCGQGHSNDAGRNAWELADSLLRQLFLTLTLIHAFEYPRLVKGLAYLILM